MWTFESLPYERPDVDAFIAAFSDSTQALAGAASYEEARAAYLAQDKLMRTLQTVYTIAYIRNTMDTTDEFYDAEVAFLNEAIAKAMPLEKKAHEALVQSPFVADFEAEFGRELLNKVNTKLRTQDNAIVPELIEEAEIKQAYSKYVAGCQTTFMGEECNFYGLLRYMENPDRSVRRAAFAEWAKLYEEASTELDAMFTRLIDLRVRMAKKLGFEKYTDLAYLNLGRVDYTPADVEAFRRQVKETIVPAVNRLREAQAKRIGVDKLRYYDNTFLFPDGNADPVGGEDVLVPIATKMYHELSQETGVFFDFMVEHRLFDLQTRPGKHMGGYMTYLMDYNAPFIFSNFNGTAADVDVLTHEAGHAFAGYTAGRVQKILELGSASNEINEIHSMAMEHFTYPWLKDMFGEDNAAKAQYAHLTGALASIPYLVSVDEFQHRIYDNPGMSAKERRQVWHEIEQTYEPWRDYDGNTFLEEGGFWMQKQHIFLYPFYYIDYALAQVGAFELYGRMKEDRPRAWADYVRLCEAGGSKGYRELLDLANLSNPFAQGSVARAVDHVIEELGV